MTLNPDNNNEYHYTWATFGNQNWACAVDKYNLYCPTGYQKNGEPIAIGNHVSCLGGPYYRQRCIKLKSDSDFVNEYLNKNGLADNEANISNFRFKCCTGDIDPKYCENSYRNPHESICDNHMVKYCSNPLYSGNSKCGCALPSKEYATVIGPPECIDNRCAGNPAAYRLKHQLNPQCDIVNCSITETQIEALNQANLDNVNLINQCGHTNPDIIPDNTNNDNTTDNTNDDITDNTDDNTNNNNSYKIMGLGILLSSSICVISIILLIISIVLGYMTIN